MDGSPDVSREYAFTPPADILSILAELNVQYLDVNETRALVIFNTGILNVECTEGELTALTSAEITVYELPYDSAADRTTDTAEDLIEKFVGQVSSTDKTSVSRSSSRS
jgi:hypothetical protein